MRLLATFSLIEAAAAVQMVHLGWKGAPASGLKDITFPISMPNAPHETGYYFEQSVLFQNVPKGYNAKEVVYTGIQPRPDRNGKSIVHATFSSFFPNTTTTDKQRCHGGADGGPGVSCSIDVEASYSDDYHLQIQSNGQTYTGTLISVNSQQTWPIGSFDLPAGISGMKGDNYLGFVEYFPTKIGDCSKHPKTAAIFGPPFTSTGETLSLTAPYKDNRCGTDMKWTATQPTPGTYEITVE